MKLRIRGNSLRLRLNQRNVKRLIETGSIEESIYFGAGEDERLTYALEISAQTDALAARYERGRITVLLPQSVAHVWAHSEQVSIAGEQRSGVAADGEMLNLLVEKDFVCLTGREGDEDADAFPHPMEGALKC